jgi:hypothetical protein
MYFLNHILKVLGIDEEIEDIKPTEYITMERTRDFKILDNMLDFVAITKSGKIIIFEFKKNILKKKDLKQVYDYYKQIYCKEKKDIIAIIIVISKEGKITEYSELDVTYHPRIIKTKNINKQKDLKAIRNKFENNIELTSEECSLLIALPIFDLKESESEIVDEMCRRIQEKSNCIPDDELEGIIIGMYLNIIEYIPSERQDELLELIEVDEKSEGVIAQFKRECRKEAKREGKREGKREIITHLLSKNSLSSVAILLDMSESDIMEILRN